MDCSSTAEKQLNCVSSRQIANVGVFSSNPPLQISISTMNLSLVLLIVMVSAKIDRTDMSKLYNLWLFLAHAPSDVIQIVISILQLIGLVDSSGNYYRDTVDWAQVVGKIFTDMSNQAYRILALIMVTATFMAYKYPFFFPKFLHPSRRNTFYLIGFIFILVQSLLSNIYSAHIIHYSTTYIPVALADALYYLIQLLQMGPMILLWIMHFLSISAILSYTKQRVNQGASMARHRRQLVSAIIYATTPNLLLFPTVLTGICNIILSTMTTEQKVEGNPMVETSKIFNTINRYCIYSERLRRRRLVAARGQTVGIKEFKFVIDRIPAPPPPMAPPALGIPPAPPPIPPPAFGISPAPPPAPPAFGISPVPPPRAPPAFGISPVPPPRAPPAFGIPPAPPPIVPPAFGIPPAPLPIVPPAPHPPENVPSPPPPVSTDYFDLKKPAKSAETKKTPSTTKTGTKTKSKESQATDLNTYVESPQSPKPASKDGKIKKTKAKPKTKQKKDATDEDDKEGGDASKPQPKTTKQKVIIGILTVLFIIFLVLLILAVVALATGIDYVG
ncbi:hypothetical protein QR680_006467 [Steinernema hermaphroditum]|uniref:Uncharacterized protein n=1 Tax=Steinernema hermaphroditum TaxID=289476 RepID=A0AA39LXG6_9BILA|nr:hypothetical protein QR680_006467 [Steinernema hermaphroditum]